MKIDKELNKIFKNSNDVSKCETDIYKFMEQHKDISKFMIFSELDHISVAWVTNDNELDMYCRYV